MKDDGLSTELVEMCSQIVDSMREQLTAYTSRNSNLVNTIYALGGAIGGYIYTLSQLMGLPLSDAFLEGFASFRRFLHNQDGNQLSMFSSLTHVGNKN